MRLRRQLTASAVSKRLRKIQFYRTHLELGNIRCVDGPRGVPELVLIDSVCTAHPNGFMWQLPRGLRVAYEDCKRFPGGQETYIIGLRRDTFMPDIYHEAKRAKIR